MSNSEITVPTASTARPPPLPLDRPASELEPPQVVEVRARVRQVSDRIVGGFLLDVRGLLFERRHRRQELLEIENPRADTGIAGAVGDRVLEVEAPEAVGILLQIQHRIAAADQHIADVELEPRDGGIEPVDEDIERDLAVDRLLVVRLVVEPEPDPRFPRDRAGGIEAIRPFAPIVQGLLGAFVEVRDEQGLMTEDLRLLETPLP